jgi:hypothetical protein
MTSLRALLCLVVATLAVIAHGAPGQLDTSYGTGGRASFNIGSSYDVGRYIFPRSDGKLVVIATVSPYGPTKGVWSMVR